MKHPSNRAFYEHWDRARADAAAPERQAFEPEPIRHLLADVFVLSYDPAAGFPFRVAGTHICAALGRDVKGERFSGLFAAGSQQDVSELARNVAEELCPAVAGLNAISHDGSTVKLEMLLLPFAHRASRPVSLTGMIALGDRVIGIADGLQLETWRYLEPLRTSRGVFTRKVAHGLTVYQGLR